MKHLLIVMLVGILSLTSSAFAADASKGQAISKGQENAKAGMVLAVIKPGSTKGTRRPRGASPT